MNEESTEINIESCGFAELAKVLGDKWILLIIRQVFYNTHKFEDIRLSIGIPRAVLTNRLKKLIELKILKRMPYKELGKRTRYDYHLEDAGKALFPMIYEGMVWGDKYLRKSNSSIKLLDKKTGLSVHRSFVNEKKTLIGQEQLEIKLTK